MRRFLARLGALRPAALLAAVACIVLAAAASDRMHWQTDLTAEHSQTLARETRAVLHRVHRRVDVIAFISRSDPQRVPAGTLLLRYHRRNHHVRARVLDPDETRGLALQLDVDPILGGLVVRSGNRVEHASTVTEQDITAGIARLLRGGARRACVTSGHGEPAIDVRADDGFAIAAGVLRSNEYDVTAIDLAVNPAVPRGCDVVIVAAPTAPLGAATDSIVQYLAAGGRALVLSDPASHVDLDAVTAPYGVRIEAGEVLEGDPDSRRLDDPLTLVVHQTASAHPVVRRLAPVVLFDAEGLTIKSDVAAGLAVAPLFKSTGRSFLSRQGAGAKFRFDPATDVRGPVTLAAAADRSANLSGRVLRTRVVVIGDIDIARNGGIPNGGNATLLVQAVDWLSLQEDLVAVHTNLAESRPLDLTPARITYARFLTAGVVPGFFLLAGALVWAVRRGR